MKNVNHTKFKRRVTIAFWFSVAMVGLNGILFLTSLATPPLRDVAPLFLLSGWLFGIGSAINYHTLTILERHD